MTFTGRLLVATPLIADPSFERTVVLLLAHGAEGAFGVVLNRPSDAGPRWRRVGARVAGPAWCSSAVPSAGTCRWAARRLRRRRTVVGAAARSTSPAAGCRASAERGPPVRRLGGVGRRASWRTSWTRAPGGRARADPDDLLAADPDGQWSECCAARAARWRGSPTTPTTPAPTELVTTAVVRPWPPSRSKGRPTASWWSRSGAGWRRSRARRTGHLDPVRGHRPGRRAHQGGAAHHRVGRAGARRPERGRQGAHQRRLQGHRRHQAGRRRRARLGRGGHRRQRGEAGPGRVARAVYQMNATVARPSSSRCAAERRLPWRRASRSPAAAGSLRQRHAATGSPHGRIRRPTDSPPKG